MAGSVRTRFTEKQYVLSENNATEKDVMESQAAFLLTTKQTALILSAMLAVVILCVVLPSALTTSTSSYQPDPERARRIGNRQGATMRISQPEGRTTACNRRLTVMTQAK
jgi:hypothetical protein